MKQWVLVLDFDGTCTLRSIGGLCEVVDHQSLAAEHFDKLDGLRQRYKKKSLDGELTLDDQIAWLTQAVAIYKHALLNREAIAEALADIALRQHVIDLCLFCKANNIPIAIVSYGVSEFIQEVLRNNDILRFVSHIYALELLFDEDDVVIGSKDDTIVVPQSKGDYSRIFADLHHIPHERILAIGDSGGDQYLGHLKSNRLGIAETQADTASIAPHVDTLIISDSFLPAIEWLKNKIKID